MVHGTSYSIKYEIVLTQPLDLYDHVLPICIELRSMLEFDPLDSFKLVVLSSKDLGQRFGSNTLAQKFVSDPDVQTYSELIVSQAVSDQVLEPALLNSIKKIYAKLKDESEDPEFWAGNSIAIQKRFEIEKARKIIVSQDLVSNQTRYTRAKNLYDQICQIELTAQEQELIDRVKSHPIINPIIKYCGYKITKFNY
jgi:hypothetical protein